MVDVLTWTIERRMRLTERAELLRKELAEVDAELGMSIRFWHAPD